MAGRGSKKADQIERKLGGIYYGGEAYFDDDEVALQVAREVREKFNVSCRKIVLAATEFVPALNVLMLPTEGENLDLEALDKAAMYIKTRKEAHQWRG